MRRRGDASRANRVARLYRRRIRVSFEMNVPRILRTLTCWSLTHFSPRRGDPRGSLLSGATRTSIRSKTYYLRMTSPMTMLAVLRTDWTRD